MGGDFRETLIGCGSVMCRFNVPGSSERTCMLKMIAIDETGRCRMAEARPVKAPAPQAQTPPGHFEKGVWVQ